MKWDNNDSINTSHTIEGVISYNGTESLPLSLKAATFFYGNDKDTVNNKNFYSTYVELAYNQSLKNVELKYFVGGTIKKGYYANSPAIINLGLIASRQIKITEQFSLPVNMSIILNPKANDIFVTFGMTF